MVQIRPGIQPPPGQGADRLPCARFSISSGSTPASHHASPMRTPPRTVAYTTIIGIPWGKACFVVGNFLFFPFGKEVISRRELNQADDIGTGALD
jgi:hypothetical protein